MFNNNIILFYNEIIDLVKVFYAMFFVRIIKLNAQLNFFFYLVIECMQPKVMTL